MKRLDYVSLFPLTTKKQARKERCAGIAAGIAAGAVIGAAVGILFAPKAGRETREDIKDKTCEVASAVKNKSVEYAGVVRDKTKTAYQAVKDKLSKEDCCCGCDSTDLDDDEE